MDIKLKEFISLVDNAIKLAENEIGKKENSDIKDLIKIAIENLKHIRDNAISGKLPRPSKGAILGLSKNIGEWNEGELYKAAWKIDKYYKEDM